MAEFSDDLYKQFLSLYLDDLESIKINVGNKVKSAMKATGYKQKHFIRNGSEFQQCIGLHMNNKGGFSESAMKKFLAGDFGQDKTKMKFLSFIQGVSAFFNLNETDIKMLLDKTDDKEFEKAIIKRWKEKQEAFFPNLLSKMQMPGKRFRTQLKEAKSISFVGISLYKTITKYNAEITNSLQNGGDLRLLMLNPDGAGIKECTFRSSEQLTEIVYKKDIKNSLKELTPWFDHSKRYNIAVRLIEFLPSYALTVIHPELKIEKSHCHVRLFTFRSTSLKGPVIKPDPIKHKYWFDYFCDQYEKLWNAGTVWVPLA